MLRDIFNSFGATSNSLISILVVRHLLNKYPSFGFSCLSYNFLTLSLYRSCTILSQLICYYFYPACSNSVFSFFSWSNVLLFVRISTSIVCHTLLSCRIDNSTIPPFVSCIYTITRCRWLFNTLYSSGLLVSVHFLLSSICL